jgi:hypothetical protein
MVKQDGSKTNINSPRYQSHCMREILPIGRIWLEECWNSVRGYIGAHSRNYLLKFGGSINPQMTIRKAKLLHETIKPWPECMRPEAGNNTVYISYNEMMLIYLGVTKLYTLCCQLHHPYSWIAKRPPSVSINPISTYSSIGLPLQNWMTVWRIQLSPHNWL